MSSWVCHSERWGLELIGEPSVVEANFSSAFTILCVCVVFGQLRSSFSKAFSGKKTKKMKTGSFSDVEPDCHSLRSNASAPNSPLMQIGHMPGAASAMKGSHSSGASVLPLFAC